MEHSAGLLILGFVTVSLLIGALTRHALKSSKVPYTVALLLIGMLLGLLKRGGYFGTEESNMANDALNLISSIDPHLILFVFLPILIFESALALEVHLFRRVFSQIFVLAVPGLLVCTLLTATLAKYVFPWDWSWPICLMFGALVSATDPVAVVALLKEVSSRKRLETLIEGESLVNDGTAIVLFTIFYTMAIQQGGFEFSFLSLSGNFIWVVTLGIIVGLVIGIGAVYWIGKVFNDPMIEITITIITAYFAFLIAEHFFHVSGVVSVVTVALVIASIGRTRISPEISDFLYHFWEMMAFIANTLIFLLVGIIIASRVQAFGLQDFQLLAILYLGVMLIRAFVILMFTPLLKRISIGFTKEKAVVLTWGGLRGAVALALALAVSQDASIPPNIGESVLFLCAGIVFMTIFINGSSMGEVLKWVGLDKLPPAKEVTVRKAKLKIQENLNAFFPTLQKNEFLQAAEWEVVRKQVNLDEKIMIDDLEQNKVVAVTDKDLSIACRRRLLETERKNYWGQFEEGLLGKSATKKLVDAVELALDGVPTISPRTTLHKYWQVPKLLSIFSNVPGLQKLVITMTFTRLAIGYDIARGFIHAQDEIASFLPTLSPNEDTEAEILQEILQNKRITYSLIEELRVVVPEAFGALETQAATRTLLNRQRNVIRNLVSSGVLDKPEAKRLIAIVENTMKHQQAIIVSVPPPNAREVLHQVLTLRTIEPALEKQLINLSNFKLYASGTDLIRQGAAYDGIYILARGRVEACQVEQGNEQIIDIFGPYSLLGSVNKDAFSEYEYRACTAVEVLILPMEKLYPLFTEENQLKERLATQLQF